MSGMGEFWRYLVGMAVGSAWVFSANCVTAQITPDRTLPNNSNVTINGSTFNITGGTQARHNLFHSFQQFSVPTGGKAIFNNGLDIQNIFNRVTGRSASSIDGTIQANGTANVFFLNPSGIVFGKNASLNIGGSFVATTANAIQFGNLGTFSASEPNNPALLTVNPSALLYKQIASVASIQNNSIASAQKDPAGFDAFGLQVPDGKSLLLVGGNISMNGGQLNAYGGRVELGGLASSGTVGIQVNGNDLSLSFPDNITRSDVSLTHGASVSVQAAGGGSITVNASDLNITGGSQLVAGIEQGLGSIGAKAGDITLNATGDIKIDGSGSYIFNNVEQQAIGNGGNISLSSNTFELTGGGQIQAVILGKGSPADVVINTNKSVSLDGKTTGDGRTTGVVTGVGAFNDTQNNLAIGKGGNIEIKTDQLLLTNGSQLNVNTFGQGNAGNITLNVSSLSLANGAQLQAISHGQGNAGSIIINATKNVFLDGSSIFTSIGSVNSTLNNLAMGKGGNIQITTDQLSLTNDAQLQASTNGDGDAGNVIIKANKSVSLDNSGILSNVGATNNNQNNLIKGKGGNIQITTNQLSLTNDAGLTTSTNGAGDAGNVIIKANKSVALDNSGILSTAGDVSLSPQKNSIVRGNGGNINITTGQLSLTNGGQLEADTFGSGNAGNVIIKASQVSLDGQYTDSNGVSFQSGILSDAGAGNYTDNNTVKGNGGSIQINTSELSLSNGAFLGASTFGQTNAGSIEISARSIRLNNVSIRSQTNSSGNGGNITLTAQDYILLRNNSLISTTAGAANAGGDGGNITINTPFVIAFPLENSDITADAFSGSGGRVSINATDLFNIAPLSRQDLQRLLGTNDPSKLDPGQLPTNDITAVSQQNANLNGIVQINTPDIDSSRGLIPLPTVTEQTPKLVSSTCTAFNEYAGGSTFTITGRGGLPPSPDELLTTEALWTDTRLLVATAQKHHNKTHAAKAKAQPVAIIPATGWVRNDKGEVMLLSTATNANEVNTPTSCPVR